MLKRLPQISPHAARPAIGSVRSCPVTERSGTRESVSASESGSQSVSGVRKRDWLRGLGLEDGYRSTPVPIAMPISIPTPGSASKSVPLQLLERRHGAQENRDSPLGPRIQFRGDSRRHQAG